MVFASFTGDARDAERQDQRAEQRDRRGFPAAPEQDLRPGEPSREPLREEQRKTKNKPHSGAKSAERCKTSHHPPCNVTRNARNNQAPRRPLRAPFLLADLPCCGAQLACAAPLCAGSENETERKKFASKKYVKTRSGRKDGLGGGKCDREFRPWPPKTKADRLLRTPERRSRRFPSCPSLAEGRSGCWAELLRRRWSRWTGAYSTPRHS